MPRKIRCLAAALALALLSAGAAQAWPLPSRPESPGVLEIVWQWLAGHAPGLTAIWEKEGGSMDPNGRPIHDFAPQPTTDAGGEMDPNGHS